MVRLRNNGFLKLKILLIISILTLVGSTSIFTAEIIQDDNFTYNNDNEQIITFELPELIQSQISTEEGVFTILKLHNSGFLGEIGTPQLPVWTRLFAVPNTQVSIEILEANVLESRHVGSIYPVQQPNIDSEKIDNSEFVFDESFYLQDITYPNRIVEVIDAGNIRDIPFVRILFYPVQYNPKQGLATIYDQIKIKLTCKNSGNILVEDNFEQTFFYNLYDNVFVNWKGFCENIIVEKNSNSGKRNTGCDYLIITHPTFYNQAKELGDWKHKKGLMTKLVNITDIGPNSEDLRQYIQNAYDNWDPCPSYFLLVGDDEYIPTNYVSSAASDLWYATVNGSDYYPDLYYGRISVDNVDEADTVVQKILAYEQNPPSESNFYSDFVVAAYFQDDENNGYETRRFVRTSEEIRDFLLDEDYNGERIYCTKSYINPTNYNNGPYGNGEPLPNELLRPNFAWDGDADDIINAIEQGIFILNHRDHGFEDGWGDPYFVTSHIEGLTNGNLTPIVFSINCLTGKFDNYECFSEEFLRKENGGAVAVFGASRVSYSGYNDFLCRGFYDAIWPDFDTDIGGDSSFYSLGEILNYGKAYMADTWGDPWGYEDYTFELFHCFGDPTMQIRTEFPQDLTVDHPDLVEYGSSIVEIYVESNGNPLEGALVCIYQPDGVYVKGTTSSSGLVELEVEVEQPVEIILTVTSHNHLFYQTNLQVGSSLRPYPPIVDGTPVGKPEKEYEYTATTTDPEEDQILYLFEWGDGTYSDWLGPYNSGESMTTSHTWSEVGNYNITVRAKDINDSISDWSEPYPVEIDLPVLDIIDIEGGLLKITAEIENTGIAEAEEINWKITLDGGFILMGKETTGSIDIIEAGEKENITSGMIFGLGSTRVYVTVEMPEGTDESDQGGYILLFFVKVNPGGS
jgi:hypothetical protein